MKPGFALRTLALPFAVELPFALLVPIGYLRLLSLQGAERGIAIQSIALISIGKTAVLAALLHRLLRPLRRWNADPARASDALLRRAGEAAYHVPRRFAIIWAAAWGLMYF